MFTVIYNHSCGIDAGGKHENKRGAVSGVVHD